MNSSPKTFPRRTGPRQAFLRMAFPDGDFPE